MARLTQTYPLSDSWIRGKCAEHAAQHASGDGKTRIYYDNHEKAPSGFGVRITAKGTAAFVLNYYARGAERRATVGKWGSIKPRLSVAAARIKAHQLRSRIQSGEDPVADERSAKESAKAAAESTKERAGHTLAALIAAYVADLREQGRPAAREIENLFDRAVAKPFPKIAALPVDDVTVEAVLPAVQRLVKDGKVREPGKLATYLRTAFNKARAARTDASGYAYAAFKVRSNPLADLRVTRPKVNAEAARKVKDERLWTLTQPQLAAYWKRIAGQQDANGAMLRLHLLTGGQRREQLARITLSDYNAEARTLTLWDGKGRRSEAREHVLPLIDDAESALLAMAGDKGPYLFTTTKGARAATPAMLDDAMTRVSAAMVEAKEIPRTITPGAIRRTVETLLGGSVLKEIRAQLQSHGLSGVQDRHYDRGAYLQEKRAALETLRQLCEPKPDNVTPIARKGKAAAAA